MSKCSAVLRLPAWVGASLFGYTAKEMSAFSPPSPVTTSPAATPPVTTPPAAVPPTAVPPTAVPPPALSPERAIARRDAVRWFVLAIASLAVAAVFSLVLVVGRTPGIASIFDGDVDFPRRSLVVHVNLALGVWFFAIIAGLFCLLPGARRTRTAPLAVSLATLGVIGFSIPMFFRAATPILSDYVLILDHWLFFAGLGVFAAGVTLNFFDPRLWPSRPVPGDIPVEAQHGVRAAALAFLVAMLTIAGAYFTQDAGMSPEGYYQRLFWGGGHILQTVNTIGLLVAWLMLLRHLIGKAALAPRLADALFGLLLLPTLAGPWLTFGRHSGRWFTRMMEFGLFPFATVFLIYGMLALWRRRGEYSVWTPAFTGWATSAIMTVIGFILGGMITVSNTLIPAHYHANIGAVTVAYMALMLTMLPYAGLPLATPRRAAWQPIIYCVGQMLFVFGYAIAGIMGQAARKVYGNEPQTRTPAEWAGMGIAGIGGLIALVGGVIFVIIVVNTVRENRGRITE